MATSAPSLQSPQRVVILGAGMVGLSTAWFLQEAGVDVTVVDRDGVAAGSSWGNAGWLTPSIAVPLPEPSVLKYGLKAVLSPSSPVYVPPTANPRLLRFLTQFARNCTPARWQQAMRALIPLNNGALDAYAELERGGVTARTMAAEPFTAAFKSVADSRALLEEFEHIAACGQSVNFDVVDGAQARRDEPALADDIETAIRIRDERFIDPSTYVHAIADAVLRRGGRIVEGVDVDAVQSSKTGVVVAGERYDTAVLATGARLGDLARPFGVRRLVQAGRGYSFTVKVDDVPRGPVYFPTQRVACTPVGDRLRIAGMMEFRDVDAPMDPRRINALVTEAGTLLKGAHLDQREDEWVGARPCTADGLPLIGASNDPRVYVAGGHGMWGVTLGPVTGKLLAEQITTGRCPESLRAVDPLR
ncbi:NAD(P)/FAD-dependent oxidoreductase [Knoellia subterranea]|uniref:D-amino acid dehydrogenase n=1 Tax=Knoellia subterranea KCTC 19937 TaxID=1385521 RepID=A0A0A0JIH1_9MICO|nr:FAD-dependent oxidoreductase [Knoellia subterranea]KGN36504.1 D-amino acid dehydrogenase [Knoellia subterranea KCTC 19937]